MNYSTLGIIMHSKCNAECDICSEFCSPSRKEMLDIDRVKLLIDSCNGTTITKIAFTGGEPFWEFHNLVELVKHAKKHGFSTSVVTNGFWATTDEKTESMLKELIDSGLGRINISYDSHHSKFVSQENINRLIKACVKYHLKYLVTAVKLKDEKIGNVVDGFTADCGLLNLLIAPCEPAGRAKEKFPENSFVRNTSTKAQKCTYEGIITVAPDGKIYPCCAHQVFGSPLSIGHYMDMDVPGMLQRIKNNGLLYILRNYGLDPFLDMNPPVKSCLPDCVSSPCEICEALFCNGLSQYVDGVMAFIQNNLQQDEEI